MADPSNESIVCHDDQNCDREHAGGAGGVPVHPPAGSRISGDEPLIPDDLLARGWTRHGHAIPGVSQRQPLPQAVARCGGTRICSECKADAESVTAAATSPPTPSGEVAAESTGEYEVGRLTMPLPTVVRQLVRVYGEDALRAEVLRLSPVDQGDALAEWLTGWFERNLTHDRFARLDNGDWAATLVSDLGEAGLLPATGLAIQRILAVSIVRCRRWHHEDTVPWTGADWSNAMVGEAGEAANVVKKLRRIETGTMGAHNGGEIDRAALVAKLAEELSDTILYAVLVADHYGISGPALEQAIIDKFNLVSEESGFPERLP